MTENSIVEDNSSENQLVPLWGRMGWLVLALFLIIYFGISLGAGALISENTAPFVLTLTALLANMLAAYGSVLPVGLWVKHYSWEKLGFRSTTWKWVRRAVAWGLGLMFLRAVLAQLLITIIPALNFGVDALDTAFVSGNTTLLSQVTILIFGSLIIPVGEEIFFRGFLHRWIRNRLAVWPAILLSGFIFGAFHIIPIQALMAFPLGILTAWMFEKSKSLVAPIVLHLTNNLVALLITTLAIGLQ